jgi:hypothetical protein
MIPLENVTIISINGRDPENSVKAINYSSRRIRFAKKILVTVPDKIQKYEGIEVFSYDIKNRDTYSFFCVKELHKYIDTDFCLIVQPDGFVINPFMWSESFLNWDYIGAPLVPRETEHALIAYGKLKEFQDFSNLPHVNGCGGFTLRSKKFLIACSELDYPPSKIYDHNTLAEDFFLCVDKKEILELKYGIKFAPLDLAFKFATAWGAIIDRSGTQLGVGHPINCCEKSNGTAINTLSGCTFGFHGAYTRGKISDFYLNLLNNPESEYNIDIYKNLKHFIRL